jgi:hypothetical protein
MIVMAKGRGGMVVEDEERIIKNEMMMMMNPNQSSLTLLTSQPPRLPAPSPQPFSNIPHNLYNMHKIRIGDISNKPSHFYAGMDELTNISFCKINTPKPSHLASYRSQIKNG